LELSKNGVFLPLAVKGMGKEKKDNLVLGESLSESMKVAKFKIRSGKAKKKGVENITIRR